MASLATAKATLKVLGFTITGRSGEYRMAPDAGTPAEKEARAYYTDSLDDAIATARLTNARKQEQAAVVATDPHFEARQVLNDLLDWAAGMGGWDAPCWKRAAAYRNSLFPPEAAAPVEVTIARGWGVIDED